MANAVLTYPCGTEYRGDVVDGLPNGVGQLCLPCGVVGTGHFVDGEAHGFAMQRMPNGDVYVGQFGIIKQQNAINNQSLIIR